MCDHSAGGLDRRSFFRRTAGFSALAATSLASIGAPSLALAAAMTREQRDAMSPDAIIESLKEGNRRFRAGKTGRHDYLAQKRATRTGQFPSVVILSCIDSRAPAEILFDVGIGETFNARVAGNIQNDDILGSMEFACAVVGAKVVLVMGHTACGAVRGAIDGAELGNLTALLGKIKPAIDKTAYDGDRKGSNYDFVDAVAKTNVALTMDAIRSNSPVLKGLEDEGKIKIAGSMYHLAGGEVKFL